MSQMIYCAGPLFSKDEIRHCGIIENMCEQNNLKYFSPRLSSGNSGNYLGIYGRMLANKEFDELSKEEILKRRDIAATIILESNIDAILNSDLIIACIDNRDPGTMFEIGYGVANNKHIITYSWENYGVNIMISQSTVYHANITEDNQDELVNIIKKVYSMPSDMSIKEMRNELYKLKDMELE